MIAKVSSYFGTQVSVSGEKVLKNNSIEREGLIIRSKDNMRISPVIYLEPLYDLYQAGESSMDDCVLHVVSQYKDADISGMQSLLAGAPLEWSFIKDHVYPMLVSTKQNKELLKTAVSRSVLDLSVVYQVRFESPDERIYSMKLTYPMLKEYGIDEETVYDSAIRNLKTDGYAFYNMEDVFGMFMPGGMTADPVSHLDDGSMFVLLNRSKQYAAAGLLDLEMIRRAAGGRDFYVLPSSIHEVIFVPTSDDVDQEMLTEMVRQVNASEVAESERLSDHAYFYNGATGKLQLAA